VPISAALSPVPSAPPAPRGLSVEGCFRWLVVHEGARQPHLGGPHTPLRRGGRLEIQLLGLSMRFPRLTSQRSRGLNNWWALIQQCVVLGQGVVMRTAGHLSERPPSSVPTPQNRWGKGFFSCRPRTTFWASRTTGLIMTRPAHSRRLDRPVGRPHSYRCSCCQALKRRSRCRSSAFFEPHSPGGANRLSLPHHVFLVALPRPEWVIAEDVVSGCYV